MQSGAPVTKSVEAVPPRQPDGFAVVLILLQAHLVVGVFDAGRNHEALGSAPLVLGEGLERLRDEVLMEVAERSVDSREDIGGILIAVGVGPVIPDTGAEDTPFGFFAEDRGIARVAVAVQLIHAARLGRAQTDCGATLIGLLVPIASGVELGVELPSVSHIAVENRRIRSLSVRDRCCTCSNKGRACRWGATRYCPKGSCPRTGPPGRGSGWSYSGCCSRCPPRRRKGLRVVLSEKRC